MSDIDDSISRKPLKGQTMSPYQIEVGLKQLRDVMPLKEKVKWYHISPIFFCCKKGLTAYDLKM